jgi:Cys-tRNA(Pro)/Cys-tRNA(Cys) deacylase
MKGIGNTPAMRLLDERGVPYRLHPYEYSDQGEIGLAAAAALGVDPRCLFKSVVLEGGDGTILAAVPSNSRVAPGKLMKCLGHSKRPAPVAPARAQVLTGYMVGGISPLGHRKKLYVCIDASAMQYSEIFVNAGRRGLMMSLNPQSLAETANAVVADIVQDAQST